MEQKTDKLLNADAATVARAAAFILIENKAQDVRLYEVGEENPITDFYLNVTARSLTNVSALADELVYKLSLNGKEGARVEGKNGNSWILIDLGDLIVNVFDKEARAFYNLDRLMPEGTLVDISDVERAVDEKLKINRNEDITR